MGAVTRVDTTLAEDSATDSLNDDAHATEHCAVDPASLAALDSDVDRQVLIELDAGPIALYTVTAAVDDPGPAARVGTGGLARFGTGTTAPIGAKLTTCFDRGGGARLTEELLGAPARGLAILAPHGGKIEEWTDVEAQLVFDALAEQGKPVQAWLARGFHPRSAHRCWHITASEISEHSFPKLAALFLPPRRFAHAIAFHGHTGTKVLVGGGRVPGNADLKHTLCTRLADALPGVEVEVANTGDLAGAAPANIVNRVTSNGNGIQIEQPFAVRDNEDQRATIARVVAEVYADLI